MRILDRYIVREIFRHALLGLVVFTFVFFVPQLVRLMELLVRHSGSGGQLVKLFLCLFPGVLTFTVPMSILVGVLLGLGRMSADSEIIALTALGIGRRRILLPVAVLAFCGVLVTALMTLWAGPLSLRAFRTVEADLIANQVSFQVQPRVFDERFPKTVLYVNDVSASGTQWHGVFLAEAGDANSSQLTLAENAIVIAEPRLGKLELHLQGGATHEFNRQDPNHYSVTQFGQSDLPIEVTGLLPSKERSLSNQERSFSQLLFDRGPGWREARVELHRRIAFPFACIFFALVAVPLGSQPRRGGRAAGTLLAVLLIASYYLLFVFGAGMARQGTLPVPAGIWIANLALGVLGLVLLPRMEQLRSDQFWLANFSRWRSWVRLLRRRKSARAREVSVARSQNDLRESDISVQQSNSFPRLMDLYILRRFLSYFLLLVAVFIFLFETFTFFELLDDIARHRVPFLVVVSYFRYLAPYLAYQLAPLAALVAVLVTLGVMSKNNEIVACKASGISLYRLAVPLLLAGLSLAAVMVVLDDTYLPYANQRQDALRNQIKGRPAQTYTRPQRWIFGENSKIYNYDLFDPTQNLFGGLTVIELDPVSFHAKRRIFANRARWSEQQNVWILENGWIRDFSDGTVANYQPFGATALPELKEPPAYFNRQVLQAFQMSWDDLRLYIDGLQRAGFDVSALRVQWHKKLAYPLIAPVSMLLAIPFALLVGMRGALGGVALGVGIAITYWAAAALLEAMGGVGQLPPLLAGWSPDLIFFFFGMYFFFRMPT
ncbi:MAG TPA: LPS export ABC transporter permease LptF [Candidatus Sulfotelmatobacter sp.]|jgi:LPS export ABC transporter permease LptF/LPS export ABC transporter permease LptG|nr:LPS export ABC transporter permease LptF [Candidatus Sulfotelmatobacter sp.]